MKGERPNLPEDWQAVSAAELRRNFGVWQERAMATPIVVVRHGNPRLVLSSAAAFAAARTASEPQPESVMQSALAGIPEHSRDGFIVADAELVILSVNRVFEDMTGRHADRLVGRQWTEVFPHAARSLMLNQLQHVLRTGTPVQFETPSVITQGRHYAISIFPHVAGVAALITSRTAEREMEAQLEEARSLAAAFDLAEGVAYARINPRGLLQTASPGFRQLAGLAGQGATAAYFPDLATAEDRPALLETLDDVLSGGDSRSLAVTLIGPEGRPAPVEIVLATIWRAAQADGAMALIQAR